MPITHFGAILRGSNHDLHRFLIKKGRVLSFQIDKIEIMKSPILFILGIFLSCSLSAQKTDLNKLYNQRAFTVIDIETTYPLSEQKPQITLSQKDETGATIWTQTYGGSSYERAGDVIPTPDKGYLVLGSTSSYGKGNYDLFVIKTNQVGEQIWFKTFGDFYNEYGRVLQLTPSGNFLIEASKQICTGEKNDFSKCKYYRWQLELDQEGQLLKEQVLEPIVGAIN